MIVMEVVIIMLGRGKIKEMMGDVEKGIKNLKKGMDEEEEKEDKSKIEEKEEEKVKEVKKKKK